MSVAVLEHVPFETPGLIAAILDRHRVPVRPLGIGATLSGPELGDTTALVIMGGPMSVNDPAEWVGIELDLVRRAVAAGTPVLGICLGAQLIASALGARVYRNPVKEIGWYPLHWTEAGCRDPLLGGLPDPVPLFQWHGETFDLPSGAEWLARTDTCPHQAFRYGHSVYALQFHAEVDAEMIADWIGQAANSADVRDLPAPIDPREHAAEQRSIAEIIFTRWVKALVLT